ncbi:SigE family RNA polymerase sigma factor [Longispora sp. NPDC051575]|uniref:SigE family RNA polymerase sigma factor n=1 Tax=Longispora sp. NPDC051575 TaxID=3154943 RepID=UPI0034341577
MRDSPEFDAFYAATAPRVISQIYAMVGDRCEAEDAVSEAYSRAWQRWATVSGHTDPAAWVRTVAYRIAVSNWRRTWRRAVSHRRAAPPDSVPAPGPDTVTLVDALRKIPAAQRRAVVLHHLAGLSVAEIAEETHASVSAVKARLSRGRAALAVLLDDKETQPCPTTT